MRSERGPRAPRVGDTHGRRLHRALADPSRARILAEVSDHGPIDVRDLADRVGPHPNTVRAHLNALADAGLVESERVVGDGPGRPRLAYRSTGVEEAELRRYRLLAESLTAFVSRSGPDAVPGLEEVGELWGHHLVASSDCAFAPGLNLGRSSGRAGGPVLRSRAVAPGMARHALSVGA